MSCVYNLRVCVGDEIQRESKRRDVRAMSHTNMCCDGGFDVRTSWNLSSMYVGYTVDARVGVCPLDIMSIFVHCTTE